MSHEDSKISSIRRLAIWFVASDVRRMNNGVSSAMADEE
ncbi:hypothetical protein T4D_10795 [Trichinella pseudospiralis]|uniref:Uncharacterized protein n=1 Tax=Trichinella pseudospiralis TaxID=6337 RepID=A0A0V1FQ86_TRIPS|nr:hypothetical protein T4D_10795 [Trichinella pseudospiralis]